MQNLTVEDVSDSHVRLIRLKGSEGELTIVSERLRAALSDVRGGDMVTHRYTEQRLPLCVGYRQT